MTLVKEEKGGTPEQECQLHAELEIMRQEYDRLNRIDTSDQASQMGGRM